MKHPQAVFVQLTTGCNAACVSCPHPFTYGKDGGHKSGNMSAETWTALLRQIGAAHYRGQIGLYLHHEPMLVKDLARKIRDVNEKTNAYAVISTNGALLTSERRKELIEAGPRTVHINISSADPEQYAAIMRLSWPQTHENAQAFIREAAGVVNVEINVPVLSGVDVARVRRTFPGVTVNADYWANSRGGLLPDVSAKGKGSRFKLGGRCRQPDQNLNVLWDGSVILCCMDWGHETKGAFPNIREQNVFETYAGAAMTAVRDEFRAGCYERFSMCNRCADEMGFVRRA